MHRCKRPQYITSTDTLLKLFQKKKVQSEKIKADPKFDGKPEKVLTGALQGRLNNGKKVFP